jgi:hypothetical protein
MERINRRLIAAAFAFLAVAGCRSETTGIEFAGRPALDQSGAGGVGTLGSGNKADSTSTNTTQGFGVGTLGSGN